MSPTLPGDLPGLLRRCSPVRDADEPSRVGVVTGTFAGSKVQVCWVGEWEDYAEGEDRSRLLLDLSDATGRIHAAWWSGAQEGRATWAEMDGSAEALRDACLRLAGRQP